MPPALDGRDVLGLAQTGTGKTAAFVLPILQRLLSVRRQGPRALVVAPTRELAAQVQAEFERLARHTTLTSTAVFGGVPIARQKRIPRQRPDVVVACPGRLLDLLSQGALCLDRVEQDAPCIVDGVCRIEGDLSEGHGATHIGGLASKSEPRHRCHERIANFEGVLLVEGGNAEGLDLVGERRLGVECAAFEFDPIPVLRVDLDGPIIAGVTRNPGTPCG